METVIQANTKQILDHHLWSFVEADLEEILKDFSEKSELLTPQGSFKGLGAIRSFFQEIFKIIPKGSALEMKQEFIRNNIAYIVWGCESPFINIPTGTDTFIIEGEKIIYQTLAAYIIPKQ